MSLHRGKQTRVNWACRVGCLPTTECWHYSLSREESLRIADRNKRQEAEALLEMQRLVKQYRGKEHLLDEKARPIFEEMVYAVSAHNFLLREKGVLGVWRYNKKKMLATPKWADFDAIDRIYERCGEMNALAGPGAYHVDHIVPLQGKNVSGLHVHQNLRIIPKRDNLKKHNHFDDSMLND